MATLPEIKSKLKSLLDNGHVDDASADGLIMMGMAALLEEREIITTKSFASNVADFHKKFGIQYEGRPRLLPRAVQNFRVKRAESEHQEYLDATLLEEKLDALIDSIYIDLGTLHLHGFTPEVITEAWRRVHQKNMEKELASAKNPGKFGDKTDIVKPEGWTPPDHTDLCS